MVVHAQDQLRVRVDHGEVVSLTEIGTDAHRVKIDGLITEAVWSSLPAYDEFVVLEPDTLTPGVSPTLVRIFYTDKGMYLGVDLHQDPKTLVKRLSGRDVRGINRDSITVTLDTSGEGRYAFWFGVNLGDSLMDGTALPERKFSSEWDGPWLGSSKTTQHGWSAEFFIPWGTVSMPSIGAAAGDKRTIGIYMSRKVAYLDERWGWPTLPSTQAKFMSELQPLSLTGVTPKQQYNIYPFTAVTRDRFDGETRYRFGADLFWRPSSNFQVNATVNPDFGGVESDDVVINLTATETFFPEKRLFFQEGQQIFTASPRADTRNTGVGNGGDPYTMVNTRRIGGKPRTPTLPTGLSLSDRELIQPTELFGAVKVSGQSGRFRYGVLGAFEKESKFDAVGPGLNGMLGDANISQEGSDYGIVRLLYENSVRGDYRGLGFLSTAVLHEQGDALAQGLDWHFLSGKGQFAMDGQVFTSDIDGQKRGYGGFVDFEVIPRQGIQYRLGLEHMDRFVDINDLGFLVRNDRTRIRSAHIRTSSKPLIGRNNQLDIRGFLDRNHASEFLGGAVFFSDKLTLKSFSSLTFRLGHFFGGFDDLNSFGNGSFRIEEHSDVALSFATDNSKRFSYKVGIGYKEESLGGDSYNGNLGFSWRPLDRMNVEMKLNFQERKDWLLHQENRNMTTFNATQWQPSLSLEYYLSAKQQFRISAQWVGIKAREQDFFLISDDPGDLIETTKPAGDTDDFAISDMVVQARYRWELAPLSDLFIVYTRGSDITRRLGDQSFDDLLSTAWNNPIGHQFVVKLRYRFGS